MATPLKDRIRAAAIAIPGFTALLGTNPFRWYDQQLHQGSAFPAVVVTEVSNPQMYALVGRFPTSFSRIQFTIWSVNTAAGMANLAALETLLVNFLETLDLVGIPGLCSYSNRVVAARDGWYPTPEPGNPQRLIDAMIYANDTL
jgi:hypothetical protein